MPTRSRLRRWKKILQTVAPAVLFAHDYHGTCISGLKAFKVPVVTPCDRHFGWQCLAFYFPRRCGGMNPITMIELYRTQSRRLSILRNYSAIVTASEHMRAEYLKHDCAPASVRRIVHPIDSEPVDSRPIESAIDADANFSLKSDSFPVRLLFMGRMDRLKGGSVLIDALPAVASRLGRAVHLVLAGAGPARRRWEVRAALISKRDPRVSVEFAGWLDQAALNWLSAESDLLVMPSLWPEPFGRAGLEAGLHRLPVAGFAVGAIPEWLSDGVNGYLAPGDPPSADGLAGAIVRCLRDSAEYARLRKGALEVARRLLSSGTSTHSSRCSRKSRAEGESRRRFGT